jgi:hypothetical protein
MPGSEFRCGIVQDLNRVLTARRLMTVFVIILLLCSVQIVFFHHYNDSLVIDRACHICKFLAVSSSGSDSALLRIASTDSAPLFLVPENLLLFFAVLSFFLGNRAPPHLLPATQSFRTG